jgi:peptidoglycan/xylan/chitin deacetylase (PgdA/CDA1 family)
MYHAIGEPGEAPARFVVPIGVFERQMAWLHRLRVPVLRLEDAVRRVLAGQVVPRRAVALTFDDGTRDNCTLGFPVLERYGFPATAFVVTGLMGSAVSWTESPELKGRPIMTWDEALAVQPLVSLQPHTRTHASLPTLDDGRLAAEVSGSREDLESRTSGKHALFAYPYGHFDDRVAAAVAEAGYTAACSVRRGRADATSSQFVLPRYEIDGRDSVGRFLRTACLSGLRRSARELLGVS